MDQDVAQRFDNLEHRMDQRFQEVDRRFDGVERRFDELKRHSGVLVEGLRHEVQLLAEGLATHIEVHHAQDRAYLDEQFRETRALFQLSYEQLRQRIETLERRGQA